MAVITTARPPRPPRSGLVDAALLGLLFTTVIYTPFAQNAALANALSYVLITVLNFRGIDWRSVWSAAVGVVGGV